MRQTATFRIDDPAAFKQCLLAWADGHEVALYLDSATNSDGVTLGHAVTTNSWDCLVAAGDVDILEAPAGNAFEALNLFQEKKRDWLFGFFAYDLKNEVENLHSANYDGLGFSDLFFFQPLTVAGLCGDKLEIFTLQPDPREVFEQILKSPLPSTLRLPPFTPQTLSPRLPKPDYLSTVAAIRELILEGDLYEMNLCQEFFAEGVSIDPVRVFEKLTALARAPFSAYLRLHDRYLLCASPERFLKKEAQKLISQPIKGTRPRGATSEEDERLSADLAASEKDRAENVMIVDLVRNDLARNCVPGSVRVEELFGIHRFSTVHQMISTVSGLLRPDVSPLQALRDAFPMGSMTGAPKVRAMQRIEELERTRRGLYSGALGYFDPKGDFDFNVVIRSILYHAAKPYLSLQVGGAIVFDSVPEEEYAECLVKAGALLKALEMRIAD